MPLYGTVGFRKHLFLRKGGTLILAFFWTAGLMFGILLFNRTGYFGFSLMRGSVFGSVSIVWFLAVSIFPLLFSALAVFLSFPCFLLLISFVKAFSFGYMLAGLHFTWSNAGWLVRLAVLFHEYFLIPLLYWFWMKHISGEEKCTFWEIFSLASCGILVIVGTYRVITPFFTEIMNL